jgi:potassium efflux system protein
MHSTTTSVIGSCIALALLAAAPVAMAAPEHYAPAESAAQILEQLEHRRTAVEGDATIGEESKARILKLLTRAIEDRRRATEVASDTAAISARIASAPARLEEIQSRQIEPSPPVDGKALSNLTFDELALRSQQSQQRLQDARDALKRREEELATMTALGATLSDEIASRKEAVRALSRGAGAAPETETPAASEARQAYVQARESVLEADISRLELQLVNYDLLLRLATLERDDAARTVTTLDARREGLVAALEARRAEAARAGREEARFTEVATAGLPEALAALGAENAELREELEIVIQKTRKIAELQRDAERRAGMLDADLIFSRERVQSAGSSEAVGRILAHRLRSLRDIESIGPSTSIRSSEVVRASDRRLDLEERRRALTPGDEEVNEIVASLSVEERGARREDWLRQQATELFTAMRETIDELHEAYTRYLHQLTSVDAMEDQIASNSETLRQFIRRELLWRPVMSPISLSDFSATLPVLSTLFVEASWKQAAEDLRVSLHERPERSIVGLVLVALLALARRPARRALRSISERTRRIRTDTFRNTLLALLFSGLIAAVLPSVLTYLGWMLTAGQSPAAFSRHLAFVLTQLAVLFAIFSANRWLVDYHGLARMHFRWPEPVRLTLRREFMWLMPVAMLLVGLGFYGGHPSMPEAMAALGRPSLILVVIAFAVFIWRLFRHGSAVMRWLRSRYPGGLAARAWIMWFPLLLLGPVLIVAAAARGYINAAITATSLLIDTGWLLMGVVVLRGVMLRWFTLSERRLRYEQALKQREEARLEREKRLAGADSRAASEPSDLGELEVPEVDFRELGHQGRAVVHVAVLIGVVLSLATLWSDLLPAMDVLDQVKLPMSRTVIVDGLDQQVAVTLKDMLRALLVLAVTLFAAMNLSGLLGFTLLRRLASDAGLQYAIVTLCQYALVTGGVLYAFSILGVQWSKLQWLVAALGVGLGFGLQEIVANFVSGIILLLERPVRVGDIVTVGNATGRVSRIRIRATTIVDWDRKELVVPNKEFVTGRLLNWTLSNDVMRMIVPVGIAYGSDPRRARQLLQEAANETEHVLDDPAPVIVFNSFGDNALGLELRVYLSSMEHWLTVQTDLHDAIYDKLAADGIEISFPQRDVHLDTSAPLDIRLHQTGDAVRGPRRGWRRWRGS